MNCYGTGEEWTLTDCGTLNEFENDSGAVVQGEHSTNYWQKVNYWKLLLYIPIEMQTKLYGLCSNTHRLTDSLEHRPRDSLSHRFNG